MRHQINSQGFTLLEVLISLFILSIIGAVITTGLSLLLKSQGKLQIRFQSLTDLQLALTIMERDFQQIIDRPIIDENQKIRPALEISENRIEFTRSGFINPFSMNQRSTLQRVAYTLEKGKLTRRTWAALDRDPESLPDIQIILPQVNVFYIHLITAAMPRPGSQANNKGISIEMNLKEQGYVKRVFFLPSNAIEITNVPNS